MARLSLWLIGFSSKRTSSVDASLIRLKTMSFCVRYWRRLLASFFLFGLIILMFRPTAAVSEIIPDDVVRVRLISSVLGVAESDGEVLGGLAIDLDPEWKIYWRSPGAFGFAPEFDWSNSTNVRDVEVSWPAPSRIVVEAAPPVFILGYADNVILPLEVRLARAGEPLTLRLKMEFGICRDVCLPATAVAELTVPRGSNRPSTDAPRIAEYINRIPRRNGTDGLVIKSAHLLASKSGIAIIACSETPFTKPDVFVELPTITPLALPKVDLMDNGRKAAFTLEYDKAFLKSNLIERLAPGTPLTVTVTEGRKAVEMRLELNHIDTSSIGGTGC